MLHCLHKHNNWFNIDFETKLYNCFAKIMFADGGGRVWVRGYCLPAISSPSTPSSCQLAPWPPPSHPEPPIPPPPTSPPPGTPWTCQVAHHVYIQRFTFKSKSVLLPPPSANFFPCSNAENIQQNLLYHTEELKKNGSQKISVLILSFVLWLDFLEDWILISNLNFNSHCI